MLTRAGCSVVAILLLIVFYSVQRRPTILFPENCLFKDSLVTNCFRITIKLCRLGFLYEPWILQDVNFRILFSSVLKALMRRKSSV